MESQQPVILDTPKLRTIEQIEVSLARLEPIFNSIWETRNQEGAVPIPIPNSVSGNGLPVLTTLREIPLGKGYAIGLYEDGRNEPSENIKPIGFIILNNSNGKISANYTWAFVSARNAILANWDPDGDAPYKDPSEEELMERIQKDPYLHELPLEVHDAIRVVETHQKRGLATLLFDLTMLVARQHQQKSVYIGGCNENSTAVIRKLGYRILEETEDKGGGGKNFTIEVPDIKAHL